MAEVLAIVQAVAGLLATSAKLYASVSFVVIHARDAPKELKSVNDELLSICSILGELEGILHDGESRKSVFPFGESADGLQKTVDDCKDALEDLELLLQKYRELSLRKKVDWALFGITALKSVHRRLDRARSSLNLTLLLAIK